MTEDKINELISQSNPIEIRTELFRQGNFDFIVNGIAKNNEIVPIGEKATHEKQKQALQILTSGLFDEFLYGGAAGGAKTWTGVCWQLFMCLCYPGIKCFIARNELKDIIDSVFVTFNKVCREYGFEDFKFNAVKNFIQFGNGSHINFIELKYKPSDPMYEDVGSTEYTIGWIEEVGETNETGATVISTRVGRHMNDEYGIRGTVLYTGNPKKNWAKREFYDKDKNGLLEIENLEENRQKKNYLGCLVVENPFIEDDYIRKLRNLALKNKAYYERLFKGNWDYEDNENALCEYEMIEQIFDNDHINEGKHYLTADVARFGSDKARIGVWKGWQLFRVITFDISKTTDQEDAIRMLRRKYQIPKNQCIADEDGVGGGVVDGTGILGFINNAIPLPEKGVFKDKKDKPNYKNLQTQCLYHLADKVNTAGLWINAELNGTEKEEIKQELDQIQSKDSDNDRKLECKTKADIKSDLGRSPDWRDMILMRMFFDLKGRKPKFMGSKKRGAF